LLTLRSDRLGELQQWAPSIGGFEQFSLPPLPPERLVQVIEGPAHVAGVSIAPGLTEAVLSDAGGADAMPLLAFTLRELWARANADAAADGPVIRLADYQALADAAAGLNPLENAVRRRADEQVAPLDPAARQALREAFVGALARIDEQGVYGRRAAAWDELEPAAQRALEGFVDARLLVTRNDDDGRRLVEVAHESLLRKWPLLRAWLDDERAFLIGRVQLQRALEDWQAAPPPQRDSALLQGLMLERARAWLADKPRALNAAQRDFIATSIAAADAKRRAARRKWTFVAGAAALSLTLIAGLGVYLRQERLASAGLAVQVEADRWLQRAAASLAYGQGDRALAQATRAYTLLPGAKTRSALWQAQVALPPRWAFSVPAVDRAGDLPASPAIGAMSALAWSGDGESLIVGDRSGALFRLAVDGERRLAGVPADRRQAASKDLPEAVLALRVLEDGSRLALLEDGRVLRQAAGAERFALLDQVGPLASARIGNTGEALVLLQNDRQLRWLDCIASIPCLQRDAVPGFGAVAAMALDARGLRFAAADDGGRVVVGDGAGATMRLALPLPAGTRVTALALDAQGRRLAVAASGGPVVVFDAAGNELARLPPQDASVQRLAWAPDGERLLVDCESGSLCLWRSDSAGGMALAEVLAVRDAAGGAIAWSADGRWLAGGDLSGRVHAWDMGTATRNAVLRDAGAAPMAAIDVQADGRRLAGADVRGQARLWELPSGRVLQRLGPPMAGESRGLRFHPRQPQLALATLGGGAVVFALDGGAVLGSVEGSFDALAWDAVADRLLTGGQDGVVRSHAVATGQGQALPESHADAVIALAVAPSASAPALVLSADTRGVIKARGSGEAGTWATAARTDGRPFGVGALGFAPDGRRWLAAGNSGDVLVYDRATHELRQRLETGADQVNDAAFSPDGRWVAALDNVGRVWLWGAADGQPHATLWLRNEPGRVGNDAFGVLGQLRRLAWLPDAQGLAIATQSGVAVVIGLPPDATPPARK
jgi:WD40 repeat protein